MSNSNLRAYSALTKHGYTFLKKVGEGSFGAALLVQHASDREKDSKAIVKMVDVSRASEQENADALKEAQVLSSLKHPYIVRYRESFKEEGWICIVMDFCEGGDLCDRIKKMTRGGKHIPQLLVVRWFTQSILALKYIHDLHILHRDLKSGNFFLSESNIKIGDFGIARVLECTVACAQTQIGTPYYLSPEICQGKPYSWSSDIWSMGCILFEMCVGRVPFEAKDLVTLISKITKQKLPELPDEYTPELKSLFRDLLERDAAKRPHASEILKKPVVQDMVRHLLEEVKAAPKQDQRQNGAQQGDAPPRKTVAGKYGPQAGTYRKHQEVEYYSETHGDWLQAVVTDVNPEGRVMLNVKPGVFISLEVQGVKVRPRGAGIQEKDKLAAEKAAQDNAVAEKASVCKTEAEPAADEAPARAAEEREQENARPKVEEKDAPQEALEQQANAEAEVGKAAEEKRAEKESANREASLDAAVDKVPSDRGYAPKVAREGAASGATAFHVGAAVRLHGLRGAAHLNGEEGVCEQWDVAHCRWHVRLANGDVKAFRPDNLEEVQTSELRPGALVRISGLKGAPELNGQKAKLKLFDSAVGRWHVQLSTGEVKALKPDNLLSAAQYARARSARASGSPSEPLSPHSRPRSSAESYASERSSSPASPVRPSPSF